MARYIVELENNHHYVLIDTVTGQVFYTPAQNDANTLATKLNNYEKQLYSKTQSMKCENCGYLYLDAINGNYCCSYKDDMVINNLQDHCSNWER